MKKKIPAICRQRGRDREDRAFVELDGQRFYLGVWGTKQVDAEYRRVLAEWLSGARLNPKGETTVCELLAAFWQHAETYYRHRDGTPTSELGLLRGALRPVKELYGDTLADDFGPRAFKAIRQVFIDRGNCRGYVNQNMNRIRRVFRWGVEEEFVRSDTYETLRAVRGLRYGRTEARESEEVAPVALAHIEAIQPHVSRQIWSAVQFQLYTGGRSTEVLTLRPADLDRSGDVWLYVPTHHKNAHLKQRRVLFVGPRAQASISDLLRGRAPGVYVFSPREAEAERRAALTEARKTPPGVGNSVGTNRTRNPKTKPGECYDSKSYRRAINRACEQADIPAWHPHQLRHSAATEVRKRFGVELSRIILGHRHVSTTELYAEVDLEKALAVIREIG